MNKIVTLLCVGLFLCLNACSNHTSEAKKQVVALPELSCVAVLPTVVPSSAGAAVTKARRLSLEQGADYLDSVLLEELGGRSEFKVLTENQLDAILRNPWGGGIRRMQEVGAATGCGGVLETSITKYRQRVGGSMSVDMPATAAYSMKLVGVENGGLLWSSSFDEEQKALFDDIFSFHKAESRGFKWLSVEELVRDSVKLRLADFPYFQAQSEP